MDMGVKTARNLAADNFFDMIEISSEYSITSAAAPESWYGKTLGELGVRARYGTNILAIKNGEKTDIMPNANTVINNGSVVIIFGANSDIEKFASVK